MSPEEIIEAASPEVRELIMPILNIEKGYRHYKNTIEEVEKEISVKIQLLIEGKIKK